MSREVVYAHWQLINELRLGLSRAEQLMKQEAFNV